MRLTIRDRAAKLADAMEWRRRFAWLPTRVSPRQIAWLEQYEERLFLETAQHRFLGTLVMERKVLMRERRAAT